MDGCNSCQDICNNTCGDCGSCPIQKCFDRLGELEDKLENGTMIDMSSKIGDTVYFVSKNILEITKGKIKEIIINKYNDEIINVDFSYMCKQFDIKYVGKTVFLTKEEAEARLKELQNGTT